MAGQPKKKSQDAAEGKRDGGVIRIKGRDFVLVPLEEYALLRRASDDDGYTAEEDAEDIAAFAAAEAARARGEQPIPEHVVAAMLGAQTPIPALRRWRGLTQKQLAGEAGIAQAHLSAVETGARAASLEKLRAIARVLKVPVSLLVDD